MTPWELLALAWQKAGAAAASRERQVLVEQQEDQWVLREEAVVVDAAGDPQDVEARLPRY